MTGPFKRTIRPFQDGTYGSCRYVKHTAFASDPLHYIRAYSILLKDLQDLCEFVEPADANIDTYSYRIHGLLMRVCIEVEANWTAILRENGYEKEKNLTVADYKKIEATHRLSEYEIQVATWTGRKVHYTPFRAWGTGGPLVWYQRYNSSKHDRQGNFQKATFGTLIESICGLLALLSAQFHVQDFDPGPDLLALEGGGSPDGYELGIGGGFFVKFPTSWPLADRYSFDVDRVMRSPTGILSHAYSLAN
ncbi:MAG: hypothetical protein IPK81_20370 [Rhodospirillales bacterium]|nr:MAG: hypothetical protein IPK81_20370 [Rhodospirillales bacterium]